MNFITELKHNTIFFSLFALLDFFVLCHSFLHWLIHPGDIYVLSVFQQLWIFSCSERWCIVCLKPKENELITFENSVIWEILWRCLNDQLDLLDRFGMSKSEPSRVSLWGAWRGISTEISRARGDIRFTLRPHVSQSWHP